MDGYPMARKGEAARALAAAFTSSAIGGIIGAIALFLAIPVLRPLVLILGPPEFFMLVMVGVAMVGTLSGKSPIKGIIIGGSVFGLFGRCSRVHGSSSVYLRSALPGRRIKTYSCYNRSICYS